MEVFCSKGGVGVWYVKCLERLVKSYGELTSVPIETPNSNNLSQGSLSGRGKFQQKNKYSVNKPKHREHVI